MMFGDRVTSAFSGKQIHLSDDGNVSAPKTSDIGTTFVSLLDKAKWFQLNSDFIRTARSLSSQIPCEQLYRFSKLPADICWLEGRTLTDGSPFGYLLMKITDAQFSVQFAVEARITGVPRVHIAGVIAKIDLETFEVKYAVHDEFRQSALTQNDRDDAFGCAQAAAIYLSLINSPPICKTTLVSRQPRKESHGTGRQPKKDFTLCEIKVGREYSKSEGEAGEPAVHKRLHLARGHFKVRKTGIFWWRDHWRGNAALGTVNKHYTVSKAKPVMQPAGD